MENNRLFTAKFLKKDGKLIFKNRQDQDMFNYLAGQLKPGSCIDFTVDFSMQDGLLSQIAKIKVSIRELAKETGYTFIEMEQIVKKSAGLYDEMKKEYKSFGNASKEELSSAIQVAITMGEECGLNLR